MRLNEAISNKMQKEERKMKEMKVSEAMEVEEEEAEEKPGFFASLFSSKKKEVKKSK